jgi:hypothetical protein
VQLRNLFSSSTILFFFFSSSKRKQPCLFTNTMGNQASKVIEKTKEKKERRKVRRRSTISVSAQSHASLQLTPASPTRANYDWLEASAPPSMVSSVSTSNTAGVSTLGSQRRRSVSDFFAKRKQSLKTTISQDEYKENDRLQRLVSFHARMMHVFTRVG